MLFLLLLLWLWLFVVVAVVVLVFERMMLISDQAGKLVVPVMVFSCCCFSFCCCCCCCCWAVDADIRSGGEARATLAFVGFATHHH